MAEKLPINLESRPVHRYVRIMTEETSKSETGPSAQSSNKDVHQQGPAPAAAGRKLRKDRWIKRGFVAAILIAAVIVYVLQMEGPRLSGWEDDLNAALVQAKEENRPVLVYFVRSLSSQVVRDMANKTLAKKENKQAITDAGFIMVKVETTIESETARRYGLTKLPTMAVLSSEGARCATMNDFAGQFIGEMQFRNDFLEPKFEGWDNVLPADFDKALDKARKEGLPVLALFTGLVSTGEARRLAFTTLASQAAGEAMEKGRFEKIIVRLLDEKHLLARDYKIARLPTLLIITPTGERRRLEGLVTKEKFLDFLAGPTSQPASAASRPNVSH
ncbi:MAG TPA: thioredoxin family protein [Phycisphaerae bacterium]|nr:thioredoxin family protein [Phycisphaerae bacterium]